MEIIIGKTSGFCFGVLNAVSKTQELVDKEEKISCLGELVHNKEVTEELTKKGLNIVNNVKDAEKNVIIRAHGEPEETYKEADKLGLNIYDLTCPKVLKIHKIAAEYSNNGFYILLIGHKEHPETKGTISYCGKNSDIIEDENDIEKGLYKFYESGIQKLLVIVQTTYSIENFNKIIDKIQKNVNEKDIKLEIKNTICNATKLRQEETKELSKEVDFMIIIGGKHSSNTNKLYQIAKVYCKNSILVETKEDIDINNIKKFDKIGIMAGASTPQNSINSVVELLKQV